MNAPNADARFASPVSKRTRVATPNAPRRTIIQAPGSPQSPLPVLHLEFVPSFVNMAVEDPMITEFNANQLLLLTMARNIELRLAIADSYASHD